MSSADSKDPKGLFYHYYGEYFAERDTRFNALETVVAIHLYAGNPDPPDRTKAIEALFELLGSGGTGTSREDAAGIYNKLREDAGLYHLWLGSTRSDSEDR
jgi:hypothetical protein